MKHRLVWACLVGVAVLTGSAASARAEGRKGDPDRQFFMKAASGGMAEVKLAQLATDHAKSDEVKKFAQHLIDDHTKANEKLLGIVSDKGIKAPKQLDRKHQAVLDKLSSLRGEEFDRAYIETMVKDHEEDVRLFEREARTGTDDALKGFAEKVLPTLREHLRMAQDLAKGR